MESEAYKASVALPNNFCIVIGAFQKVSVLCSELGSLS